MSITSQLKTIRSNFSLGILAFCVLNRLKREDLSKLNVPVIGEDGLYCIPPGKSAPKEAGNFYKVDLHTGSNFDLKKATLEFSKMLLRNFTLDSYEALFCYCETTDQLTEMQNQSWYGFARMVRNSLTHTQHWRFTSRDLQKLPVSWRNKTIDANMDGQELNFDFYDWWDGCELWAEMFSFAETLS